MAAWDPFLCSYISHSGFYVDQDRQNRRLCWPGPAGGVYSLRRILFETAASPRVNFRDIRKGGILRMEGADLRQNAVGVTSQLQAAP